jgi:hypothetical protein
MPETLTIGEIAQRVAPLARHGTDVVGACRHLAKKGLLLPVAAVAGTGNYRRYSSDEVYIAAVYVALAALGQHPGEQFWVSEIAWLVRRAALPQWKLARSKNETRPLFVGVMLDPHLSGQVAFGIHETRPSGEGAAVSLVLDLSVIWLEVEKAA